LTSKKDLDVTLVHAKLSLKAVLFKQRSPLTFEAQFSTFCGKLDFHFKTRDKYHSTSGRR